jgi:hypothetical protein
MRTVWLIGVLADGGVGGGRSRREVSVMQRGAPSIDVVDWVEFVNYVDSMLEVSRPTQAGYLFRAHSRPSYRLEPSLLRTLGPARRDAEVVDRFVVQAAGGWKTASMMQRYAHLEPSTIRAAVERLVHRPAGANGHQNGHQAPGSSTVERLEIPATAQS